MLITIGSQNCMHFRSYDNLKKRCEITARDKEDILFSDLRTFGSNNFFQLDDIYIIQRLQYFNFANCGDWESIFFLLSINSFERYSISCKLIDANKNASVENRKETQNIITSGKPGQLRSELRYS